MQEPVDWGTSYPINTTTDGNQLNSHVIGLEGGGYVVVWESNTGSGASTTIEARVFDANGSPLDDQFTVAAEPGTSLQDADVVALPGGGFAVTWSGTASGGSMGVRGALFDEWGVKQGSDFDASGQIDPSGDLMAVGGHLASLANGDFVLAYSSYESDGSIHLAVQRFDAAGAKIGGLIDVGADPDATMTGVQIADLGGGRFGVVWMGIDGDYNVYGRIYNYDGTPATASFPVATWTDLQGSPDIAGDGTGNFLITYRDNSTEVASVAGGQIGQLYDGHNTPIGSGTPQDTAFEISDPNAHGTTGLSPTTVGLHTGGYLSVWIEWNPGVGNAVVGQLLASDGTKVGGEFVVKQGGGTFNVDHLSVAELADGRVVVTWEDNETDASGSGIDSQIIDPRGGVITGTEHGEALKGTVWGQATSDTITALGGNDSLSGGDGNDSLLGGEGNDTLVGDYGNDTMEGGNGDDTYTVGENGDNGDVIVESLTGGTDKVIAYGSYTLTAGAHVETLQLSDASGIDVSGNELANTLIADASDTGTMRGGGGNDVLDATAFNLNVKMFGGTGNDTYVLHQIGQLANVTELAGEGNDTIQTYFDLTLPAGEIENITLLGSAHHAIGNGGNNKLTGNAAADTLEGGDGNDTMTGGAGADTDNGGTGNDTYVLENGADQVIDSAGIDTITSSISRSLMNYAAIERLVLTGTANINGTGNGLGNALTGNTGNNSLSGGDGNDTMTGGAGADTDNGGKGNDTYVLENGSDKVIDSAGIDTITSTVTRSLAGYAAIERLTLVGTANINGTGNDLNNLIVGNAGKNVLNGGKGNDDLRGGGGVDSLWGGVGNDKFTFLSTAEIGKIAGQRDIIKDFLHAHDRIDLSAIDANSVAGGNQAFSLVTQEGHAFTGVKGQLVWDQQNHAGTANDVTLVSGDINGDKHADFTIELHGLVSLTQGDFVL